MLQLGVLLFLLALLIGLAIPALAVPRLGVAAHINGVIGALFLLVLGLLWPQLHLSPCASGLAFWLAAYSFFTATLMPLLGGFWQAGSAMLPLAAGAARGTAFQEGLIATGLVTAENPGDHRAPCWQVVPEDPLPVGWAQLPISRSG